MTIEHFGMPARCWQKRLAIAVLFACLIAWAGQSVTAQHYGPTNTRRLQNRVTVSWTKSDLIGAFNNLSSNQRIPIFVDRRVDPNQPISMRARNIPVGEAIYRVAEEADCGVCWLGGVAYVAPQAEVARLCLMRHQLLKQINRLPTADKRKWLSPGRFEFPRLTNPAELWQQEMQRLNVAASDNRTEAAGQFELPDDLWPGISMSAIHPVDRLLLMAYGFEKWPTFREAEFVGLVSVDDQSLEQSEVRFRVSAKRRTAVLAELAKLDGVEVTNRNNTIVANGNDAVLYQVARKIAQHEFGVHDKVDAGNASGKDVVSVRFEGSLDTVLNTAAVGLGVELQFDPALRSDLHKQVDLNARRVTYEELIEMALRGTELSYSIDDGKLIIRKK